MSHDLNRRRAAYWDKQAGRYDREMNFWDRHLFGDSRPWACGRAAGDVLEVAVGTGRNLSFYPDGTRLTGVDWSPAMLGIARPPSGAAVRKYADQKLTVWQFGWHSDTVDYVRVAGPPVRLIVEVRDGDSRVGAVETRLDASGLPLASRLIVPGVPARLDITFYSNLKARPFAADTWTPPQL